MNSLRQYLTNKTSFDVTLGHCLLFVHLALHFSLVSVLLLVPALDQIQFLRKSQIQSVVLCILFMLLLPIVWY